MIRKITAGREDNEPRRNAPAKRLWYALKTTMLQTRVFRARPVLSIFHSFIFYCFVLYGLVNLIDAAEGFTDFRLPVPASIAFAYGLLTDLFSVLATLAVFVFVLRRFFLKSRRDFSFNPATLLHPSVRSGYIQRDSLIVAAFIVFHVGSRVVGNAARLAMEGVAIEGQDRAQPFSSLLAKLFAGPHAEAWRIFGYWGALGSILLFLLYFPSSKHMHLFMAPLKYFFRRDGSSGELPPVALDLEDPEPAIGAVKLNDLAWPRLLDAYACIQCNRCQDVCPASGTGKALSPAALEINKRMVMNQGGNAIQAADLLQAVISPESVWACTTCGACMEVCPTHNEQMLDIIDIRRNQVMLQGEFPSQLQTAFRGMERFSNPWGISQDKRMAWAESLDVPTIEQVPDPDVLYWVGCAASYDPSAQRTARAVVQLLSEGGVKFAVLGKRESCTGDSARRAGNEMLYQQLATTAVATLNEVRPRLVLASCPHCVNTISAEYPQLGGNFTVMHHTEYLASMVDSGKLKPLASDISVTFHDPCYLGRHRGSYEQPRSVLNILSNNYVEMERSKANGFCCGAGGAQFWKEEEAGTQRVSENRFQEAQGVLSGAPGDKVLAVGCPFCKSMLQSTPSAAEPHGIVIKDVAELLLEGVQRAKGATPKAVATLAAATLHSHAEPLASSAAEVVAVIAARETPPAVVIPHATEHAPATSATKRVRSKWVPPAQAIASAEAQVEATAPVVVEPVLEPVKAPERKKWTPVAAAIPPAETAAAVIKPPIVEAVTPVVEPPVAEPARVSRRKMWVPPVKAANPPAEPVETAIPTAHGIAVATPATPTDKGPQTLLDEVAPTPTAITAANAPAPEVHEAVVFSAEIVGSPTRKVRKKWQPPRSRESL
ncbi:MAG TPA: heterodisulfide reductase-related iron-sulfur binding cluster [Acidobacteriaceae bacterium]|jgi:Fe-S oxidoreductase/nitrate reductase gamma subunit